MFPTDSDNRSVAQTRSASFLALDTEASLLLAALESDAKVSLAGPVAQVRHEPSRKMPPARQEDEWAGDVMRSRSYAVDIVRLTRDGIRPGLAVRSRWTETSPTKPMRCPTVFWKAAQNLVDENWPAIERTAEALLTRRILTQDDVDAILAAGSP